MGVMTALPWGREITQDDLDAIPWIDSRVELVDGSLVITRDHKPFTIADRDALPDDGHRHELLDGALVMGPSPSIPHQDLVLALAIRLNAAQSTHLKVAIAPVDVVLADDTVLQPDLLVARRADFTHQNLPAPPLLVVEVLSPSTRRIDLHKKRERYERAGVPSYWVIDPDTGDLTAWELTDGAYVEIASITRDQTWQATQPFEITLTPNDLLA